MKIFANRRPKRLSGVLFALSMTAAIALPRVAVSESLADALVAAYVNSGLLEQNRAVLRAADEDVALAVSVLKPVLRWTGDFTQQFGTVRTDANDFAPVTRSIDGLSVTASLIAEILVYDFGSGRFAVEGTKETVLATRETLVSIEQQVLLRAVVAYFGVLRAEENLRLSQNNVRLLSQELQAAEDRFEVGEVTRTDVALAESQLAAARSNLAGSQGELLQAEEEYRNAVGQSPGTLSPPPKQPTIDSNIEAAKALALRRHPEVRAAQFQVSAAELFIRSSEADMAPRITLNGSYGYRETFNSEAYEHGGTIGVQAGQIIYQGGALSATVRRNMAQRDQRRANLIVVSRDVAQNVGNAYASLNSARAQIRATEEQVRASRIAFEGVREEAKLGARTTLDVLVAEQQFLDAQTARVDAVAQVYVAAYGVLASTGQLTARDLGLPVQIYDPAAYYNLVKDSPAKYSKQGEKLDRVLRALQKE